MTNDYASKICPFKRDAILKSSRGYTNQWTGNDDSRKDHYLACDGPKCMGWINAGGPNMSNCRRMR